MMKKSQILAAIALAMALGVVAPVAVAENSVYAASTTQVAKDAQKEIDELKANKFGTITTYDAAGAATEAKGVAAYNFYATNAGKVNAASEFVENTKNTTIATNIRSDVVTAIDDYKNYTDVKKVTDAWGSANLATTIADVNAIADAIKNSEEYKLMSDTDKGTADNVISSIKALITTDAINTAIDAAIKADAEATTGSHPMKDLQALYGQLVKDDSVTIQSQESLSTVLAAVKNAMPQLGFYNTVSGQIAEVESAINNGASDETIARYLATLKKLVNGQITPAQADEENKKNDAVNAPATGIAGTAEGTATTVSIVAGLATALTALGAGVVAYRSARRK